MTSRDPGAAERGEAPLRKLELLHAAVTPKTTWSFVRITDADGIIGVGEASLMHDSATLDAAFGAARVALAGASRAHVLDHVDNAARPTLADAAIASALEQAVWDLEGRQAGLPVWRLLGGSSPRGIPLYANINRRTVERTPAAFLASAREAVAAGFGAFKIAPFDDVTPDNASTPDGRALIARGLERVAAVREAIGPARGLYVDCHWRFTSPTASEAIDALAAHGVEWFECPLAETLDAIPAIVALRHRANDRGMRLAGLEELRSPEAFAPWLESRAYDVVMPDVKYCGGIAALIEIGTNASQHGVACAPHNPTGPVCHAASLAACGALPEPVLLEHQWDETPWFHALVRRGLPRPSGGRSTLPDGPGLGVELDFGALPVRTV